MARSEDTMAVMAPLDIPHSRMGSGTSWVPDASAMRHYHYQKRTGRWMLMGHGLVDLYYDHQATPRGDDQFGSTNWLMGMAMGRLGGGMLQLDAMLSAEPFTVGGRGYPLLLQSGESYQGEALHDRQHPHDLFMELSASYEHSIGRNLAVSLYAAPVGEPALGPVAFMHRPSAQSDPFASIAHHWQDVTHISFGVATAGIYSRTVKLEGSVFNGREPDEDRYDFDFHKLDSWSARLLVNPRPEWSLNASYGFLKSPEGLHPDESQHRLGASLMRTAKLGSAGEWATALIYGANKRRPSGLPSRPLENSIVAESNLQLDARNVAYGRVTWVQKDAEELVVPGFPPERRWGLTTVALGYARELLDFSQTALELGLRGELGFIPGELRTIYGTRHPAGVAVYLRLRPMAPQREPQMKM
ncbi:MAG TPA: hypothetical protein VGP61_10170 [Gemmatimonadales bacterium]|nr:hypothetical protein [Gemmatimonadales bacterium]